MNEAARGKAQAVRQVELKAEAFHESILQEQLARAKKSELDKDGLISLYQN